MQDKGKENHCPFGCQDLDDLGYCPHLVGFTNDGETVEVLAKHERGHWYVLKAKQKVKEGDILVNPTFQQLADGIERTVQTWVSSRVYRPSEPKAPRAPMSEERKEKARQALAKAREVRKKQREAVAV